MRILTFLHSFEPGGVERIALRLVRQWRAQGVDAPLFVGRDEGAMRDDVGAGLAAIIPADPGFARARWETLWMIRTLPGVIRAVRPDVLFCAGNTYAVIAVALKLLLGRDCPPIVAKISNNLDRPDKWWGRRQLYRLWLRILGRYLDRLIGMEMPMLDEIGDALRVPADRIDIIPDPALSRPLIDSLRAGACGTARPSAGGRHFVAVGRLVPQKNVALMLRAFARGGRESDRLTIIGEGPERPELEALAGRLGLGPRVHFRGYVSEPAAILPEFDVLLLSSNYEGVPAVILEALAAGLPIVATDCSRSMPALLRGGALGTLVPVGDEAMLARAIARAEPASQDMQLSRLQAERFTVEHASTAYLEAMAKLLHPTAGTEITRTTTAVPPLSCRHSTQVGDPVS